MFLASGSSGDEVEIRGSDFAERLLVRLRRDDDRLLVVNNTADRASLHGNSQAGQGDAINADVQFANNSNELVLKRFEVFIVEIGSPTNYFGNFGFLASLAASSCGASSATTGGNPFS